MLNMSLLEKHRRNKDKNYHMYNTLSETINITLSQAQF